VVYPATPKLYNQTGRGKFKMASSHQKSYLSACWQVRQIISIAVYSNVFRFQLFSGTIENVVPFRKLEIQDGVLHINNSYRKYLYRLISACRQDKNEISTAISTFFGDQLFNETITRMLYTNTPKLRNRISSILAYKEDTNDISSALPMFSGSM